MRGASHPEHLPSKRTLAHALVILAVCAAVYVPWLGTANFAASEGHRVVPGWTILKSGDWLRLEMFGTAYLRKPPGMPWAIAASGYLFGPSEWSARGVSALCATLAAFVTWLFCRRWFGHRAALAAALAQALTPTFWLLGGPGRTAEIEMLLILGAQLAAFALIHVMTSPREAREHRHGPLRSQTLHAMVFIGCAVAGLAKGLAALPMLPAIMLAVVIARGSLAGLRRPRAWVAAAFGMVCAALCAQLVHVYNTTPDAVRETGEFLWTDPVKTLVLGPAALAAAFPTSLALLFVFGRHARQEHIEASDHEENVGWARAVLTARTIGWAWVMSAVVFTLLGVSNHRYMLPAAVLLPPLVGYVVRGMIAERTETHVDAMMRHRARIARVLMLGARTPSVWGVILLAGALASAYVFAHREEAETSRRVGRAVALAADELGLDFVYADGLIEARPDVLLYAQRTRAPAGETLRQPVLLWQRPLRTVEGRGVGYLVRTDEKGDERGLVPGTLTRAEFRVGAYVFELRTAAIERASDEPPAEEAEPPASEAEKPGAPTEAGP